MEEGDVVLSEMAVSTGGKVTTVDIIGNTVGIQRYIQYKCAAPGRQVRNESSYDFSYDYWSVI